MVDVKTQKMMENCDRKCSCTFQFNVKIDEAERNDGVLSHERCAM
jgi:hypothetical protein